MPHFAFISLALGVGGVAYLSMQQAKKTAEHNANDAANQQHAEAAKAPRKWRIAPRVDALALEVGYGLIGLVSSDDDFLNRIREIRRQSAIEMGIIVPSMHVTDNLQLPPREYSILLRGERIADGEILPDAWLAIDPGVVREQVPGIETTDPAFGMPAVWMRRNEDRDRAVFRRIHGCRPDYRDLPARISLSS